MLRQPVDLKIRMEVPKLLGNRDVSLRVPKPDRRGDVKRAPAASLGARPGRGRSPAVHELSNQEVDPHRVPRQGNVPSAMERDQVSAGRLRERLALNVWTDQVAIAVDDKRGAAHPRAGLLEQLLAGDSDPDDCLQDRL